MKVIVSLIDGKWRFLIINRRQFFLTSPTISKLLNISLEEYENRVINNVIKHKNTEVIFASDFNKRNVAFKEDDVPEENYVDRFKEEFAEELTLIVLGGDEDD